MKKFMYSVLAAATMLFATTSCSQEEEILGGEANGNNTQQVTFTVQMPGEDATSRAIADGVSVGKGNMADKLIWALYEKGKNNCLDSGVGTTSTKETDETGNAKHTFTATINMVKGLTYNVVFLAYNNGNPAFQLNEKPETTDLTMLTLKNELSANQESYDAFVKCQEHTVKDGDAVTEVTLQRPFAQINAATSHEDLARSIKLDAKVVKSQLAIENVPTQINLLNGEVSEYKTVTYTKDNILYQYENGDVTPNNELLSIQEGTETSTYNYLNMAYVLAGEGATTESTHNATFTFYRDETITPELVRTLDIINLPIQRNYRTNVIGNLLTEDENFKIVIDDKFAGDVPYEYEEAVTKTVATAEELQAAIDAATGSTIIKFENDIDANTTRAATSIAKITIIQKPNVDLLIDGCEKKFNGYFKVHSNSNRYDSRLTFRNINFETSDVLLDSDNEKYMNFIYAVAFTNEERYSQNITVEDCNFTAIEGSNAQNIAVALQVNSTQNLTVKNCTATNLHSLMQAQSCDMNIDIDNVSIINCENGIAFGNTANPSISNSTINVTGYGIRGDGCDVRNCELVVKDTKITAEKPIIIRKVNNKEYKYSVVLEGNNTLNATGDYQVVFTNGSHKEAYVEPTGNYSISGAEGLNMFPVRVLHEESGLIYNGKNTFYLYNAEDLQKAVTYFNHQTNTGEGKPATLELEADIDLKNEEWTPWGVMWITFNGNNHTISNVKVSEGWRSGFFGYLGAVTINNLTLKNVNVTGAQAGILAAAVEGVTTENIKIEGTNSVTYKEYSSADYTETWGGIGAVTGVLTTSTINAEIVEGAKVELYFNGITTQATFKGYLSGYLNANNGNITQNGTLQYGTVAYGISNNGTTATFTAVDESDNTKTVRSIVEENQNIKSAVVSEGIEIVGNRTFRRCYGLESVTLPSTLTTIEEAAFQSCNKLSSITIPSSVTTIGVGAFAECTSLTSINIPTGVTRIEKDALRNTGLTSIEFPAGVTYFGTYALRDCESLTEVTINAPSFTIENNTFTNMAAPVPTMTIYVVNEEMKTYLEATLTNYDKSYISVVIK